MAAEETRRMKEVFFQQNKSFYIANFVVFGRRIELKKGKTHQHTALWKKETKALNKSG